MRGVSYAFGPDVINNFLDKNGFDLICRAHQVVEDGYEFQANRSLVTIFSAPNYCGEFDNAAAMMVVKENLVCSFKVLRPSTHKPPGYVEESPPTITVPEINTDLGDSVPGSPGQTPYKRA